MNRERSRDGTSNKTGVSEGEGWNPDSLDHDMCLIHRFFSTKGSLCKSRRNKRVDPDVDCVWYLHGLPLSPPTKTASAIV